MESQVSGSPIVTEAHNPESVTQSDLSTKNTVKKNTLSNSNSVENKTESNSDNLLINRKNARLRIEEQFCPDCKQNGDVFEDTRAGQTVCRRCGLVLQEQFLSDSSEWRTFSDSDSSGPDPNRIGGIQHYLLADYGDFSTGIEMAEGSRLSMINKMLGNDGNKTKLQSAIREIKNFGHQLSLPKDVQDIAAELFKQLMELNALKNRKNRIIIATCVYIASKACRADRPLKELCESFEVQRKQVSKTHSEIMKLKAQSKIHVPKPSGNGLERMSTAELFAVRYLGRLRVRPEVVTACKLVVRKIIKLELMSGQQPATVASAAVYLAVSVSPDETDRRTYKEIAAISQVSPSTITTAFRKRLFPNRERLIPSNFASESSVVNLAAR